MTSISLHNDFRINLFQEFELWMLNAVIYLLSQSTLVRRFVRNTFSMFVGKPLSLWAALIVASGLAGILSGYAYAQVILH